MLALLTLLCLGQTPDEGPSPAQLSVRNTSENEWVDQLLEDGRHARFGTRDKGPVHVWRPRTYRKDTAGVVVYLHGFYTDVDRAVVEHQLFAQFRDSGRNALFIVPETRSGRSDPIGWTDLEQLLALVERRLHLPRPRGGVTVIAHSGGYRTVVEWLQHEALERIVLVDGHYGGDDELTRWLSRAPAGKRAKQLVLIGFDTQQHSDWFLRRHPEVLRIDDVPYLFDELPVSIRAARLLYVVSERFDHMGMVTTGKVVPWVLHTFR